ncbi:autophagy protein 12-like [Prorops nasuta]|uniref:autophagy protein 12-like n=1 Tax=Prorops nasuta TaxID=863751 RepID=UPI0034CEBD58
MSEKEDICENNIVTENVQKNEEILDNLAAEEAPSSLDTINTEIGSTKTDAQTISKEKDKTKIDILLKATANAPIMKQKKWSVSQDFTIARVSGFMRKYLKLESNEQLFLYINQTFAPAPDQTVKNLYECYGTDGKLIIHYCKSHAWG